MSGNPQTTEEYVDGIPEAEFEDEEIHEVSEAPNSHQLPSDGIPSDFREIINILRREAGPKAESFENVIDAACRTHKLPQMFHEVCAGTSIMTKSEFESACFRHFMVITARFNFRNQFRARLKPSRAFNEQQQPCVPSGQFQPRREFRGRGFNPAFQPREDFRERGKGLVHQPRSNFRGQQQKNQ